MMTKQIKFTVGNDAVGYKTVEIAIDGDTAIYEILRGGLLDVEKKISSAVKVSEAWLDELDALNIFDWEENYSSGADGLLWNLTFDDDVEIYRGRGANAYPEQWEQFLDWLDALIPELQFVDRRRLEYVLFEYSDEILEISRAKGTIQIDKAFSKHTYYPGDDIKKFFAAFQKILDSAEFDDIDLSKGSLVGIEVTRHDGTKEAFETLYNENFLPGLTNFLTELHDLANDLTAKIFTPPSLELDAPKSKLILCKVQFAGSYKHYTYRTDDETLAVGDVVDVPVGKYNDTNQARIVEIGYFEEYEAPFPVERIKKIIGKHIAADWENY